jgi:hypothetical protein|tara:strand:+ start:69 stop:452 length:384 start_codon:yes stop_codon:yes gene_type:complete
MDIVDHTLREWRRSPFVYGQSDCMLSIGKYLAAAGAKDVTDMFAGKYSTHEGALEQMASHGGCGGLIAMTGAVPVNDEPMRGDVLEVAHGEDTIGGLCTGGMVAVRLDRGVVEVALKFVEWRGVWRV